MGDPPNAPARLEYRRRSRRVKANVPVIIRRRSGESQSETARTLVVNAHGGLLLLAMPVALGDLIILKNPANDQEVVGRVAAVGIRLLGKSQIGVEFLKPEPDFWRLEHPEIWDRRPARD